LYSAIVPLSPGVLVSHTRFNSLGSLCISQCYVSTAAVASPQTLVDVPTLVDVV